MDLYVNDTRVSAHNEEREGIQQALNRLLKDPLAHVEIKPNYSIQFDVTR